MRKLRSSNGVSCATPAEQFTWSERGGNSACEIDIAPANRPTAVATSPGWNVQSLGNPDAGAFSAPGTLLEHVDTMTSTPLTVKSEQCTPALLSDTTSHEENKSSTVILMDPLASSTGGGVRPSPALSLHSSPSPPQRTHSAISNQSASPSITSSYDICRICHCESSTEAPLISPCCCSGSLKYVHQKCLQQWIKSSQTRACEVCRFTFIMETKVKPFRKWEKLDISSVERRKILCSVTFHVVAITCVVWSLYVLIDRTAEEIRAGQLDWPFWTKLVVVAIGFTGGIVFMYVQCKMYFQLFRRWQSYNKVIYVQNGPAGGVSSDCVDCGADAVGGGGGGLGKYVTHSIGDGNGSALNK